MNSEFSCYVLRILLSDHTGSYDIIDRNNKIIGYSEGYTIKRRSILVKYEKENISHELIKRDGGIYLIQSSAELIGVLKIHTLHTKLELKCLDETRYIFTSDHFQKIYRMQSLQNLGIASCNRWQNENIGVALTTPLNCYTILSSVIATAYDIRTSAKSFFQ